MIFILLFFGSLHIQLNKFPQTLISRTVIKRKYIRHNRDGGGELQDSILSSWPARASLWRSIKLKIHKESHPSSIHRRSFVSHPCQGTWLKIINIEWISYSIFTWRSLLQLLCNPQDSEIQALIQHYEAAITRLIIIEHPEVSSFIIASACMPEMNTLRLCLRMDCNISVCTVNCPVKSRNFCNWHQLHGGSISIFYCIYWRSSSIVLLF